MISWLYDIFNVCVTHSCESQPITQPAISAKNIYVRAEWLGQSGRAPSEPSETFRWQFTPRAASIPCVALHIALHSLFHCFFSLCRSPILNEHSGGEGQLWPYLGMGALGTRLHWDCNAMGDAAKTTPRVPSTCAQNAILSLLIIHIIPSREIYVAIDNPSLVPSVSCLTTSSYLWNYVRAADDVSQAENLQRNSCRCCSHLYKFRDRIQVTRVFRYCGECQG